MQYNTIQYNTIQYIQGRADTQEHRGVTSRPDQKELNRQELNTQNNKHIITKTQLDGN